MDAIVSSFGSKCHTGASDGSYSKICRDPKKYLRYDETRYLRYDEISDHHFERVCNEPSKGDKPETQVLRGAIGVLRDHIRPDFWRFFRRVRERKQGCRRNAPWQVPGWYRKVIRTAEIWGDVGRH
eukprot:5650223-Pleurochrysis_carterae.AAC.1